MHIILAFDTDVWKVVAGIEQKFVCKKDPLATAKPEDLQHASLAAKLNNDGSRIRSS